MIKRRFYRMEHADGDDAADSSSSSSDSELEGHATEEESEDDNDDNVAVEELKQNDEASSGSSGYESEESSADEINVDSSGVICENDDDEVDSDDEIENDKEIFVDSLLASKRGNDVKKSNSGAGNLSVPMPSDIPDCILQIKSVFRCRICPRIVCLTEETMRAHLNSKRHARSEKLLKENRLKSILNSDGQIENQETAAELHARIVALVEDNKKTKKSNRRQRRGNMSRKKEKVVENSVMKKSKEETCKPEKVVENSIMKKSKEETRKQAKKKRKSED